MGSPSRNRTRLYDDQRTIPSCWCYSEDQEREQACLVGTWKEKISYSLIEFNRHEGENLQAEFLTINPFAKLPVLIDSNIPMPNGESLKLFQSGAILLY